MSWRPPRGRGPASRTSSAPSRAATSSRTGEEGCAVSAAPGAPSIWADQDSRPVRGARLLGSRVVTFCLVELQKLKHDRTELVTRAVQPVLWLVVFGETFSRIRAIPTGNVPYLDYLAPGIIAQSALLGVPLTWNPLRLLGVVVVVVLGAAFFSCLSMTIAGIVLKRDRLMGIGQAITMPLFFASNALYPISLMPGWLQAISRFNPLSYEVEALRGLLIGTATNYWIDFTVLGGAAIAGILAAAALLGRLSR